MVDLVYRSEKGVGWFSYEPQCLVKAVIPIGAESKLHSQYDVRVRLLLRYVITSHMSCFLLSNIFICMWFPLRIGPTVS